MNNAYSKLVTLDDYQIGAIEKLQTGSVLCGGTGSGKSRTSLAYYYYKVCNGDYNCLGVMESYRDLYIITTAKKRDSKEWDMECMSFGLTDFVVDSWNNIGKYVEVEDAFFIFDEQRVVGKGAWVKSFLKICKANDWILLSATPGDKYEDYIPLFLANGFYRSRTEFNRQHVVYKQGFTYYPIVDRYLDEGKLNYLIRKIIVQLPYNKATESIYINVPCKYDKELYKKTSKDSWNYIDNCPIDTASEFCMQLRKIVNTDPSRIEAMLGIITTHPKVVIFYSFDYELDLIKQALLDNNLNFSEWNGHKHDSILTQYDQWCYLVQYNAGSEGWNCIETDTLIYYSLQYSYRMHTQAAGRIDRRNTPFTVLYYYILKSTAGIDLRIYQALQNKEDFNYRTYKE